MSILHICVCKINCRFQNKNVMGWLYLHSNYTVDCVKQICMWGVDRLCSNVMSFYLRDLDICGAERPVCFPMSACCGHPGERVH